MYNKLLAFAVLLVTAAASGGNLPQVGLYQVHEIVLRGPEYGPKDNPVAEVQLTTQWEHESGIAYEISGFWDGNGSGGMRGNAFKVRFCPNMATKARQAAILPTICAATADISRR